MAPVLWWERQIGQHLVLGLIQELSHTWEACTQLIGDAAPLLTRRGGIRLHKDGADRSSHHADDLRTG